MEERGPSLYFYHRSRNLLRGRIECVEAVVLPIGTAKHHQPFVHAYCHSVWIGHGQALYLLDAACIEVYDYGAVAQYRIWIFIPLGVQFVGVGIGIELAIPPVKHGADKLCIFRGKPLYFCLIQTNAEGGVYLRFALFDADNPTGEVFHKTE